MHHAGCFLAVRWKFSTKLQVRVPVSNRVQSHFLIVFFFFFWLLMGVGLNPFLFLQLIEDSSS